MLTHRQLCRKLLMVPHQGLYTAVVLSVTGQRLMSYHFFFTANSQLAKFVQDPEEGIHHAHGPPKDDTDPDDIGCKSVGGVAPKPPIVPWAPIP